MKSPFNVSSIVDFTIENHPQLSEINMRFPMDEITKRSLHEILYKRVFMDMKPFSDASDEQHKLVVVIIESFMIGYAFGNLRKYEI